MKKILIPALLALATTLALAQGGPGGGGAGPGPQPQPWLVNGSTISYNGCVTVPVGVTGGCKGAGTINTSGLYVNGANAITVTSVFGRSGPVVATTGDYSFPQISGTLAVIQGGTGLTGGTSGGVPYYATNATMLSSAALTNHGLMLGGGVAGAPTSLSDLGTTSKALIGNASGAPTWAQVPNAALVNPATTVNGQTCTLGSTCTITAAATGITVGTTTISGGSSGRVEYNNAGVLGEMTTSGSGTVLVLATGPTIATLTTTGVTTIASGAVLNTPTSINLTNGTALPLTSGVTGILPGANGGTANGFFAVSGPATSLKTFTFPNASANILTDNAVVTGAQGGTGVANTGHTLTFAGNIITTGANPTTFALGATGRTYTFPDTSGTMAELGLSQTWALGQTFSSGITLGNITGSTQCLRVNSSGVVSGAGADCATPTTGTICVEDDAGGASQSTASTTFVQAGYGLLNWHCVPTGTTLEVTVTGIFRNNGASNNFAVSATYGTGTAPSLGAAITGVAQCGRLAGVAGNFGPNVNFPYTITCHISGLTPGVAVWFDNVMSAGAGTTLITNNNIKVLN